MSQWHSPLITKPPSLHAMRSGYIRREYPGVRAWHWVLGGVLGFIVLSCLFMIVLVLSSIGRVGQLLKDKSLNILTRGLTKVLFCIPEKELETIRESLSPKTSSPVSESADTVLASLSSAQLSHMGSPPDYLSIAESPYG
jgi:hypothetical protein